jgi:hypothetical protein
MDTFLFAKRFGIFTPQGNWQKLEDHFSGSIQQLQNNFHKGWGFVSG